MKRSIATIMAIAITLALVSSLALTASAADSYQHEFNFLDTTTYESFVVHNNGMKAAGNSTTMGYKGWIGSANAEGATSVFEFKAGAGYVFQTLTINYRGYSIAGGEPDGVRIYVSTTGEEDYAAGYTDSNWTLVAAIINDATAGDGINVADPSNRDPENLRSVDVSIYAMGHEKLYMRIDFYRSTNIESTPATFFAPAGVEGEILCVDPSATEPAPVVTEPVVTEPVVTEPVVTDPVVTDPVVTDPVVTDPEATEPEATEPQTPDATDAPDPEKKGCGGMVAGGVAIVAIIGTALIIKKRD